MKKTRLKAKEVSKWLSKYNVAFSKKDICELWVDDYEVLAVNNKPSFFKNKEEWIPTLQYLQTVIILKKVTVDMGAIKFVVNGADIMRPGIVAVEDFDQNDVIVIVDETHGKAIAIGVALLSSEEMEKQVSGKSVKNIHYVGDDLWKFGG